MTAKSAKNINFFATFKKKSQKSLFVLQIISIFAPNLYALGSD